MEITYDYYRIFYYVAKYKSFSKAASALNSNQPNITKFMNNLEGQLQCKLFVRSNRGITLTPEGEKLYAHVSVAYTHLRQAERELADDESMQSGVVNISSCENASKLVLMPVLAAFHERYPGIKLRISNISTPQALQLLRNGVSDFAVVTGPTDISPQFKASRLASFTDLLVGSQQYAPLCEKGLGYQEVLDYPIIGLGQGTMTYEFYTQLFLRHGLLWKMDTEVGTTNQILPMVECNLGIAFLPDFLARKAIAQKQILQIPLTGELPSRDILLVEDRTRHLNIAATRFKRMLIDRSRGIFR